MSVCVYCECSERMYNVHIRRDGFQKHLLYVCKKHTYRMPFKEYFLLWSSQQCSVNSRVRCTEWYILFLYSAPHNILRSKIWASLFSRLSVSVSPLSDSREQWSGLFTKCLYKPRINWGIFISMETCYKIPRDVKFEIACFFP